eukprot:gnl/Chilomastix_cuspidata/1882.p2 GENE.gnl/Chilomastix_cuspidata/1882~~gnl/Chilomastix_cuspidata/1882.p2  ORF type:complete len:421 (-),score=241.45 gnl/Chilomastix_cuspidata/1882:38-1300(-)
MDLIPTSHEGSLERAREMRPTDPAAAATLLMALINDKTAVVRTRELAARELLGQFVASKQPERVSTLLSDVLDKLTAIPKARLSKLIRDIIDGVRDAGGKPAAQIELCESAFAWAKAHKRVFLRQRMQYELCALLLEAAQLKRCIETGEELCAELKQMDAKRPLVEIALLLSNAYSAIGNFLRAKAALILARSTAESTYCPPSLQTQLDNASGRLALHQGEFGSAYGYFFEAMESLAASDAAAAQEALQMMLLAKVMARKTADIDIVLASKNAQKVFGRRAEAVRELAGTIDHRDVARFQEVRAQFADVLQAPVVTTSLDRVEAELIDGHIVRALRPFSRVTLDEISELIGIPRAQVVPKLSFMILSGKLHGTIDQTSECLVIPDEPRPERHVEGALAVVEKLRTVVTELELKVAAMHAE